MSFTAYMERFAGLNNRGFGFIEVFVEILLHCLSQKCLLFSKIKERCLYSRKIFCGTLKNSESLAQQIVPHSWYLIFVWVEMWIDQLYIFYYNLHGISSLTTPAVSSILMSTDNITSSKHNYDELLNIHQYFPYHNIVLYAAQKNFANPCELLCHGLHLWWLTLASHCSPQLGEQWFMKYGFMVAYMASWPQGIKCFSFIMMWFLQLAIQRSNSSWWHHDSQKVQTLVNS